MLSASAVCCSVLRSHRSRPAAGVPAAYSGKALDASALSAWPPMSCSPCMPRAARHSLSDTPYRPCHDLGSATCLQGFFIRTTKRKKSENEFAFMPQGFQSPAPTQAAIGLQRSSMLQAPPAGRPPSFSMLPHLAGPLSTLEKPSNYQGYALLHPDMSARLAALRCGLIFCDCLLPECATTICVRCTAIEDNLNSPLLPNECRCS